MTTITASKRAQPSLDQVERAVALAAKLLATHSDRSDRKAVTAGALGRAVVVTPAGQRSREAPSRRPAPGQVEGSPPRAVRGAAAGPPR